MKTRLIILGIGLTGFLSLGLFRASADLEVSAGVSIHATTEFVEPLAAHGTWVTVDSFGQCWRPAGVVVGWRPYCDGYWEWTDCGWYWVSDEPWAWACYHYGTWDYDSTYGWIWVPGVEWAPCWVDWRIGGGYIGWVPCAPPGIVIAPSFCVFVQDRHFHDHIRPDVVIVNNATIIKKTTEIRNVRRENRQIDGRSRTVVVNEGPRVDVVEKATGHKFTPAPVQEVDRRTSVSIPDKVKHRTDEPVPNERPHAIQEQPKPIPGGNPTMPDNIPSKKEMPVEKVIPPERTFPQTPPDQTIPQAPRERIIPQTPPDKTIPQTPPERIIPPVNKELPADKELQPKRVSPPSQPLSPVSPVMPSGNPGGNEKGQDKDKDHGHDNP